VLNSILSTFVESTYDNLRFFTPFWKTESALGPAKTSWRQ